MDKILNNLNSSQREAVLHIDGPLLILAGAGSGKTRVITHRIAYMLKKGIKPWNILAVTFTNKAAEEMKSRVERLASGLANDVLLSTYHSFCAKFLRVEAKNIGLNPYFIIYDEVDQKNLVKECLAQLELDDKKYRPGMVVEIISRAKDELIDSKSYEIHSHASGEDFRIMISKIYQLYDEKLKKANALDFGDLIVKAVEALRDNEALREKYQERFKYVLIDEYQDTNHAQYLLAKYISAKHKNICVVGDEDQSIYMWRGADIRNILEFERDYKQVKVIKLEQNYRSTKNILSAASNVIRNNMSRKEKELWTDKETGELVTVHELSSEIEEARFVVREIKRLTEEGGFSINDFAIFYRTNAQSRVLEDALRQFDIPYKIFGSVRFYDRAEVKDILAFMRVCVNNNDSLSLKRIINVPGRGIGKSSIETLEKIARDSNITLFKVLEKIEKYDSVGNRIKRSVLEFKKLLDDLIQKLESLDVYDFIKLILSKTRYLEILEEEDTIESDMRIGNLKELVSAASDFQEISGEKKVHSFLEQITLVSGIDDYKDANRYVPMMTIHLAKGLEFPVVFMTGMEEGLFPIGESVFDRDEIEEERRLCYVGMTRAKDKLYLLSAAGRKLFGQSKWNIPSRFITETKLINTEITDEASENDQIIDVGSEDYRVGMRVQHPEFGEGKIIDNSGSGENIKVTVLFDSGQRKKLVVKYAKLQVC
ncbi:MAG: UvrD-helicase domain-containing protein [bacterium]